MMSAQYYPRAIGAVVMSNSVGVQFLVRGSCGGAVHSFVLAWCLPTQREQLRTKTGESFQQ